MLVAAGFHIQSDGKVPTSVCARAVAFKKQAAFRGKARAAAVIRITFGGSTLLSH